MQEFLKLRTIIVKSKGKQTMFTLNCKGRLLTFDSPIVMGIINVTPDSFYKESRKTSVDAALEKAEQMTKEGAMIIDIGGQSTRPGSNKIEAIEELERIIPVIEAITQRFPETIISVDTYYSLVAKEAVQYGASVINDISSGYLDGDMLSVVANLKAPYVCMHMIGTPATMQQNISYKNVTIDVLDFLIERINACERAGIVDIIIDPGLGFGKTITHNFKLLHNLTVFKILKKPILLGISRKSTIYKTLGVTAADALNGTTALNIIGLINKADILRVHDVKEAVEAIKLFMKYTNQETG